jgi:2-polyprenyl-6-methoxyphenol hydroxylase-like FAD-dependent oxidoreductase
MPAVHNALVVGGGASGAGVAILLAQSGVSVDLVELQPAVTARGSGITLQGNALRVLRKLGVLDECQELGHAFDKLQMRHAGPEAAIFATVQGTRSGGPDLPSTMGMNRPDLARILMTRAEKAGAHVRFGTTVESLTQDDHGVDVTFSDASVGRYEVVIGADGIRSKVRDLLGLSIVEQPTGLGVWRVFANKPAGVTGADLYYGSAHCLYAGYTPTSDTTLYAHITEDAHDRSGLDGPEQVQTFVDLTQDFFGPWEVIRTSLDSDSPVNYTRITTHLLPAPWNRGRVVVIGDAAHTCPPTIAQGAAMALEDASVLGDLLATRDVLDSSLWDEFTNRRQERVAFVVESSHRLALWWRDRVQGDVPAVMGRVAALVAQPE